MVSKAGTISPAPKISISIVPSDIRRMVSARKFAPVPRPGKFRGQVICILKRFRPWAIAGLGKLEATARPEAAPASAAPSRKRLLFTMERLLQTSFSLIRRELPGLAVPPPPPPGHQAQQKAQNRICRRQLIERDEADFNFCRAISAGKPPYPAGGPFRIALPVPGKSIAAVPPPRRGTSLGSRGAGHPLPEIG